MPSGMPQDIWASIDQYIEKKLAGQNKFEEGVVVSISGNQALVRIIGAVNTQSALLPSSSTIAVKSVVVMYRPRTMGSNWVIIGALASSPTGNITSTSPSAVVTMAPPNNITDIAGVNGAVTLQWDCPAQKDVTFEVQSSATGAEIDATTELNTRGAYGIIPSTTNIYLRIRSISTDLQYSSWSDWQQYTPVGAAGSAPSTATYITQTPDAGLDNEQALSTLETGSMQVETGTGIVSSLKSNLSAIVSPTATDDSSLGYLPGSIWINTTSNLAYTCVYASPGAAVWSSGGDSNDPPLHSNYYASPVVIPAGKTTIVSNVEFADLEVIGTMIII